MTEMEILRSLLAELRALEPRNAKLTLLRMELLVELAITALAGDRVSQRELCERLDASDAAVSRNIDALRDEYGLFTWKQTTSEDDGRLVPYRLTSQGERKVKALVRIIGGN